MSALATLTRIPSLLLKGTTQTSEVASVLRDATINRTIEGASTLTLEIYDDSRTLLRSGIFSSRTTVTVDDFTFELVQVRKSGSGLSLTFEDLPIAALRRKNTPLKVSAGTITHVEFAERLVTEEGWLNFWVPPELRVAERSRIELSRGKPDAVPGDIVEDSWAALGRIANERGWRRYVLNKDTIAYVPETYLVGQEVSYILREGRDGVDDVDFDFDIGKPTATVSARVRAGRWSVPVGSTVSIEDLGPANGNWIVSSVSRSLFSLFIDVSFTKARPVLPEPEAPATTASTTAVAAGTIPLIGGPRDPAVVGANVVAAAQAGAPLSPAAAAGASVVAAAQAGSDDQLYPDDPTNLVKIGQGGHRLIPAAAESFARVAAAVGRPIPITDSYRSTASQAANYAKDPSRFAKPGGSAHGEGRAVDVNLGAYGVGNMSSLPTQWNMNPTWKRLNEAFMAEGWCNYQYHNGTTKGRTSEPWHWAYKVCK